MAENEKACPPATQDIAVNLDNRKKAIDTAMYGPLNPAEPNEEYWNEIAGEWNVDAETAKKQVCGNCVMFNVSPEMKDCISSGLTDDPDTFDAIDAAGELGYCEAFDFKCASARTCRAWVAGGPITAAASKPAPKKDQIKGSKKNPKGSASGGKKITFSAKTETALRNKVTEHNKKASDGRKATLSMLKAVYRRGAGAYSSSHRPGKTRDQWAMARVNAFLRLLKSGRPANPNYKQDNDLLPAKHPRSSKRDASALTASALIPEEKELADALIYVTEKHGKFDQDGDGVWAGYTPAAENKDAKIGVSCMNCVFYTHDERGNDVCKIIALPIEDLGKCRFAVIPEGVVEMDIDVDDLYAEAELSIKMKPEHEYESPEHAILAMAEFSGQGYEIIPALRAAWMRAVRDKEEPFTRAAVLASALYNSKDADLLPVIDEEGL